jgi:hypothetical protein
MSKIDNRKSNQAKSIRISISGSSPMVRDQSNHTFEDAGKEQRVNFEDNKDADKVQEDKLMNQINKLDFDQKQSDFIQRYSVAQPRVSHMPPRESTDDR